MKEGGEGKGEGVDNVGKEEIGKVPYLKNIRM